MELGRPAFRTPGHGLLVEDSATLARSSDPRETGVSFILPGLESILHGLELRNVFVFAPDHHLEQVSLVPQIPVALVEIRHEIGGRRVLQLAR